MSLLPFKTRINLFQKKSAHCCGSSVSDHHQFALLRKNHITSVHGPIHLEKVVKQVQFLIINRTSLNSSFFCTVLQICYVNIELKLFTLKYNFNQLIISLVKCLANEALTACNMLILKSNTHSQYLTHVFMFTHFLLMWRFCFVTSSSYSTKPWLYHVSAPVSTLSFSSILLLCMPVRVIANFLNYPTSIFQKILLNMIKQRKFLWFFKILFL